MKNVTESKNKSGESFKKCLDAEKTDQMSITDPDARLMEIRHGINVCYNIQVFVNNRIHLKETITQQMIRSIMPQSFT